MVVSLGFLLLLLSLVTGETVNEVFQTALSYILLIPNSQCCKVLLDMPLNWNR